ncbi:hypothetical protein [Sphingosinicella sp. CPCC 101087]|uniref:hypothetical protein n=1 Tax=Sphingosinicella sp. CPCC 101087 TaxID=2497754 RepID=UPI00101CC354|nr:hypothetical protein [Sphingosinicella sp. CPCC 101087]
MSDLDLEHLGDVWRQRPDPAELAELRRTAETVRRRAKWGQRVDTAAAVVVAGVVALLVLRNPKLDTLLVGGGAILLLLVSQVRQRRLRAAEMRSLTGTTEEMLDQTIDRVSQTLKRSRLGLFLAGPAILMGLLLAYVVEGSSGGEISSRIDAVPGLGTLIQVVAGLGFAAMAVRIFRQYRRSQRELERLSALREAYRHEGDSTTEA